MVIDYNRDRREAYLADGQILKITDFFRYDERRGDAVECHPDKASTGVAGPDRDNKWWSIDFNALDFINDGKLRN